MILSMTGFGDATLTQDGVTYHLEVRSLNNWYLKLNCKLPDRAAFLEASLDARLRRDLGRGSIFLNLQVRNMSAEAAYEINEVALASYLAHMRAMGRTSPELPLSVDLATAILLPGVAQPRQDDEQVHEQLQQFVGRLLDDALGKLLKMRRVEGDALRADLTVQLDRVAAQLAIVAQRAPVVVTEYQQRLADRVNQLLSGQKFELEADALAREVALFADRSDINEEISRLRSHLDQFAATIRDGGAGGPVDDAPQVGRRLDFLSQELLREANTIASKSNDAAISRACVEIKSAIDRIKEQVQNVV